MPTPVSAPVLDVEGAVLHTYTVAARAPAGLCCQSTDDPKLIAPIPPEPYAEHFAFVETLTPVAPKDAPPFPCGAGMLVRDPREMKGGDYSLTTEAGPVGSAGGNCF